MPLVESETTPDWYKSANDGFIKVVNNLHSKYHADILSIEPEFCGCSDCQAEIPASETKEVFQIFDWLRNNRKPWTLTLSKDNPEKFSFSNKEPEMYDYKKRKITTLTRFIMRNTGLEITDNSASIVNRMVLEELKPMEWGFQLFKGDDILRAYGLSVGGRSCMTKDNGNFVKLYAENPNISLVVGAAKKYTTLESIATSTGAMRCLVWEIDEDTVAIDRMYRTGKASEYSVDEFKSKVADFLKSQFPNRNIVLRKHNDPNTRDYCAFDASQALEVEVNEPSNSLWPYLDTFKFCRVNKDKTKFIISSTYHPQTKWILERDNGSGPSLVNSDCTSCGNPYNPRSEGCRDDMCARCTRANYYTCEHCETEYSRRNVGDAQVIVNGANQLWCNNCYSEDAGRCFNCGCDYTRDSLSRVRGKRSLYCGPCITSLGYVEINTNAATVS